ncbi:MAG: GAF domain-containing protein [Candidatus Rokubacteria bacterium]|nr:GAF domain-containing protein [Candidatus Rokubacteria bacterium]
MRVPSLSLLARFSLLSLGCVLALMAALGWVTSRVLVQNMQESEWQTTAQIVRYQARTYGLEQIFIDPEARLDRARIRSSLSPLLSLPEVVRVKAWDRDAVVLWSDDERLIGRSFSDNPDLAAALRGQVRVQLKSLQKPENVQEREFFGTLAEVYVPIFAAQDRGPVIGVLEVYKVPQRLYGEIRKARNTVWATTTLGGLLLYLSLFWAVRVSHRIQTRAEAGRRKAEAELLRLNQELEQRVVDRTAALEAARRELEASNAAVSRLLEESERRRQRVGTLAAVSRRLTAELDLPGLLGSISEAAAEIFEGEAGFRLAEGEWLVRVGATPGAMEAMSSDRIRIGESISGRVAATARPYVTADTAEDSHIIPAHRARVQADRTGALMCVPVRMGSRVLGTLIVYGPRGHRFDDDAVNVAQGLADQAGIAIENARLYEAAVQARREAEMALSQVKQLHGLLPICAYCKKVRNDRNYWEQIETYIGERSQATFSHGICPECNATVVAKQLEEWRQRQR